MDLQIKDVAELLNVSEMTIRKLLSEGKIPSYRINEQDRFSRLEIEDWMMHREIQSQEKVTSSQKFLEKPTEEISLSKGMQHFCLYRALHQGDVFTNLKGKTKEDLIRITTGMIAPKLNVDAEVLSELLIDREHLMSTALSHGIAVPHTRDFLRKGPLDMVFVVYPEEPIEYGALDGHLVHTLFFLFASTDKGHLQLLSKLAHLGSHLKALQFLQERPGKKELLEFVRTWEGNLRAVS